MSINDAAIAFYAAAEAFFNNQNGGSDATAITATHTADNTVTNASETILAANAARKGIIIQNTNAAENARIRLDGGVATTTTGLQLKPGASITLTPPTLPKGAITAIREGATDTTIHVVEFS